MSGNSSGEAARAALRRGVVAVDTSVAALAIHADLDISTLSAGLDRVLIADQLLFDAQYALDKTSNSPRGSGRYDPVFDAVVYSEVDDEEHARKVDNARRLVEMLSQWQKTPSIRIRPEGHPQDECLEPWDSSIRVALGKDCPLWLRRHSSQTTGKGTEHQNIRHLCSVGGSCIRRQDHGNG